MTYPTGLAGIGDVSADVKARYQTLLRQLAAAREAMTDARTRFGVESAAFRSARGVHAILIRQLREIVGQWNQADALAAAPKGLEKLALEISETVTGVTKKVALYGGLALAAYLVLPMLLRRRRKE